MFFLDEHMGCLSFQFYYNTSSIPGGDVYEYCPMKRTKRQKKKHSLKRYGITLGLIVLIVFLVGPVWSVYQKERAVRAEKSEAVGELEALLARKAFLEAEVARLSSKRGIEEEVRTKFPVAQPGEEVIVVVDEEETATSSVNVSSGLWRKARNLFR